jgi:uncharacterized repeat protein (TIGR03803 family)
VFEIAKTPGGYANSPTTLVNFSADGGNPLSDLTIDANGNLFGTTAAGKGTAFEIAKTADGYATSPNTVSFNGSDGSTPLAGLIADASGNLFGTTFTGGANNSGTVFEITDSGFVPDAPFASLNAALVITRGQRPGFTLDARFRLGAGSNGINPPVEPVTLQIGSYTATIPADSFRKLPAGKSLRVYAFSGKASNVRLAVDILSLDRDTYQFGAAGAPLTLTTPNPVPVSLRIGDDAGSTLVKAVKIP